MSNSPTPRPPVAEDQPARRQRAAVPDWLDLVARHVAGTDYGVVQITVHGSRVVQVDWTQRARFASGASARREE
ncbi:MAG: YezD family protein [Deltaproteobacteria bacterium]|nr:YezD family protein [Deltaproteobacteria bacterium]